MTYPYPYPFPFLTPEQIAHRRVLLDKYGQLAQYSTILPILFIQLSRLVYYILTKFASSGRIGKTEKFVGRERGLEFAENSLVNDVRTRWRRIAWWADGDVGWWMGGSRRQAIVAAAWTAWLTGLVFWETGDGESDTFQKKRKERDEELS